MSLAEERSAEAPSDLNPSAPLTTPNCGTIVSIRGTVVDVLFERDLPPIYSVLHAGASKQVIIEVMEQLDLHSVRGIALTATQELARGMQA